MFAPLDIPDTVDVSCFEKLNQDHNNIGAALNAMSALRTIVNNNQASSAKTYKHMLFARTLPALDPAAATDIDFSTASHLVVFDRRNDTGISGVYVYSRKGNNKVKSFYVMAGEDQVLNKELIEQHVSNLKSNNFSIQSSKVVHDEAVPLSYYEVVNILVKKFFPKKNLTALEAMYRNTDASSHAEAEGEDETEELAKPSSPTSSQETVPITQTMSDITPPISEGKEQEMSDITPPISEGKEQEMSDVVSTKDNEEQKSDHESTPITTDDKSSDTQIEEEEEEEDDSGDEEEDVLVIIDDNVKEKLKHVFEQVTKFYQNENTMKQEPEDVLKAHHDDMVVTFTTLIENEVRSNIETFPQDVKRYFVGFNVIYEEILAYQISIDEDNDDYVSKHTDWLKRLYLLPFPASAKSVMNLHSLTTLADVATNEEKQTQHYYVQPIKAIVPIYQEYDSSPYVAIPRVKTQSKGKDLGVSASAIKVMKKKDPSQCLGVITVQTYRACFKDNTEENKKMFEDSLDCMQLLPLFSVYMSKGHSATLKHNKVEACEHQWLVEYFNPRSFFQTETLVRSVGFINHTTYTCNHDIKQDDQLSIVMPYVYNRSKVREPASITNVMCDMPTLVRQYSEKKTSAPTTTENHYLVDYMNRMFAIAFGTLAEDHIRNKRHPNETTVNQVIYRNCVPVELNRTMIKAFEDVFLQQANLVQRHSYHAGMNPEHITQKINEQLDKAFTKDDKVNSQFLYAAYTNNIQRFPHVAHLLPFLSPCLNGWDETKKTINTPKLMVLDYIHQIITLVIPQRDPECLSPPQVIAPLWQFPVRAQDLFQLRNKVFCDENGIVKKDIEEKDYETYKRVLLQTMNDERESYMGLTANLLQEIQESRGIECEPFPYDPMKFHEYFQRLQDGCDDIYKETYRYGIGFKSVVDLVEEPLRTRDKWIFRVIYADFAPSYFRSDTSNLPDYEANMMGLDANHIQLMVSSGLRMTEGIIEEIQRGKYFGVAGYITDINTHAQTLYDLTSTSASRSSDKNECVLTLDELEFVKKHWNIPPCLQRSGVTCYYNETKDNDVTTCIEHYRFRDVEGDWVNMKSYSANMQNINSDFFTRFIQPLLNTGVTHNESEDVVSMTTRYSLETQAEYDQKLSGIFMDQVTNELESILLEYESSLLTPSQRKPLHPMPYVTLAFLDIAKIAGSKNTKALNRYKINAFFPYLIHSMMRQYRRINTTDSKTTKEVTNKKRKAPDTVPIDNVRKIIPMLHNTAHSKAHALFSRMFMVYVNPKE